MHKGSIRLMGLGSLNISSECAVNWSKAFATAFDPTHRDKRLAINLNRCVYVKLFWKWDKPENEDFDAGISLRCEYQKLKPNGYSRGKHRKEEYEPHSKDSGIFWAIEFPGKGFKRIRVVRNYGAAVMITHDAT